MGKGNISSGRKSVTMLEFLVRGSVILAIAAFAVCSKKTAPVTSEISSSTTQSATDGSDLNPKYGGILRVVFSTGPATLGWVPDIFPGSETSVQPCLESLLRSNDKGEIYPWLAKSYKIADDLKSITFTLRKGVKFHDGSDLNAGVAKWNLDNLIQARKAPNWGSVDILDDYTIRVNFIASPPGTGIWNNILPLTFADYAALTVFML